MPTIRFTKDYKFAEDGINYTVFVAGQVDNVSQSCADSAIQAGSAEKVREGKADAPMENKSLGAAPKNKTAKAGGRKTRNS